MAKIKICGLTLPHDIDIVNETQPDYIGFVFAESRRRVTRTQAVAMKERLDARIKAVGVFVNAAQEEIIGLCNDGIIDMIQLHGDEDAAYIADVQRRTGLPVVKAVRVQSPAQVLEAQKLPCEYLLLDTYHIGAAGGTGVRFDHSLIPKLEKPFFLAGGLNAGNIKEAVKIQPYCIDVSSGAEMDGVKDADKIKEIVKIIRNLKNFSS